jgi:hypothetical protein
VFICILNSILGLFCGVQDVEQLLMSHQHSSSSSIGHTKQRVTARVLELVLAFDGPHFAAWCRHSAKNAKRGAGIVKNGIHNCTGLIVVDTLSCKEGHSLDFNVLQTIAMDCIFVHNNSSSISSSITPAAPAATVNATANSSSRPSSPLYLPALSPVHMLSLLSFLSYIAERASDGASGGNNSASGVHQQLPPHMIKFDAGRGVSPVMCYYIPES